jgi:hypothetical protein
MPQTAQYPKEIPKTKATMMVKSKRNESRNGVISLSFYRPKAAVVNAHMGKIGCCQFAAKRRNAA